MPLDEFTEETMRVLGGDHSTGEVLTERVKPMRFADRNGGYDGFFQRWNDSFSARAHE